MEALKYYMESNDSVGEHHVTFHNQGLCYYSQGKLEVALAHFEKSIALNKDYEKARSWIEKVTKELATRVDSAGANGSVDNSTMTTNIAGGDPLEGLPLAVTSVAASAAIPVPPAQDDAARPPAAPPISSGTDSACNL